MGTCAVVFKCWWHLRKWTFMDLVHSVRTTALLHSFILLYTSLLLLLLLVLPLDSLLLLNPWHFPCSCFCSRHLVSEAQIPLTQHFAAVKKKPLSTLEMTSNVTDTETAQTFSVCCSFTCSTSVRSTSAAAGPMTTHFLMTRSGRTAHLYECS